MRVNLKVSIVGCLLFFRCGMAGGAEQAKGNPLSSWNDWTAAGSSVRFMGLVHHTDSEREWAYDRKSSVGRLDKAWDEAMKRGWTVANMKTERKKVFAFEP